MHDFFFSFILCISMGVDTSILKGEERGGGEKEKDDKWGKWEASTGMFLRGCVGNSSSIIHPVSMALDTGGLVQFVLASSVCLISKNY